MVDSARTESFPIGSPAMLPSAVAINPSGNDQYQWYKDGAPIEDPYGTTRNLDITLGTDSVTPAEAGDYHYTIDNAVATGLTLSSRVITVAVSGPCGNGILNDDEICDDGNLGDGDGCSATCYLENEWRGGAGCAVGRVSDRDVPGWLLGLPLLAMIRRSRRAA
jgi:cysteine-rich repeat protein